MMCAKIKGYDVIIDEEDTPLLSLYNWRIDNNGCGQYYLRAQKQFNKVRKQYTFHRIVMNCPNDKIVDHINGNTLDNRKSNLRICNNTENVRNSKLSKISSTGYKGVRIDKRNNLKNKYQAYITCDGKFYHIGYYFTPEEAGKAYDKKALELFGEYAKLNFKGEQNDNSGNV